MDVNPVEPVLAGAGARPAADRFEMDPEFPVKVGAAEAGGGAGAGRRDPFGRRLGQRQSPDRRRAVWCWFCR